MSIWEICIRRPVFTTMLVVAPIVLGLASLGRLGVELFPNADIPWVIITATQRGASAEEMETSVTKVLEEAANTVSGIDTIRSTSKEGYSQVDIAFKIEKNGDLAGQEVDAKIRTILLQLPEGTTQPVIDKVAIDAFPVCTLAVSGKRDVREVTEIAKKRIKEDLETLNGVGTVFLVGGRTRAINIVLDPQKIAGFEGLTIDEIRQTLLKENQEIPGGRVDQGQGELTLRFMARAVNVKDIEKLIVANRNGRPLYISDVGRVEDTNEEPRNMSRLWVASKDPTGDAPADNAVSVIIQKRSGANTVEVVNSIKKRLKEIIPTLPEDVKVEIIRDQARFVQTSIEEVKIHLLLAIVLVSLSILFFLRDWRTTVIATLSIPTSIIATFAFMDFMGFSINTFTMLGLILAVGIVVDDAVVIHENIFRHMEEKGYSAWKAAGTATKEIALAVVATTFSLAVIFAPIAFMGGLVGRFLSCFGWVVGFAVIMSMLVSFTMTPMLCSRFLKHIPGHSSKSGLIWRMVEGTYVRILAWSLRNRWLVVVLAIGIFLSTPVLFMIVGKEFVAKDDQSELQVVMTLPEGTSLSKADAMIAEAEHRLRKLPGVAYTYSVIGEATGRTGKAAGAVNVGNIYIRLIPHDQRNYTQFDVMRQAREIMQDFPDYRSSVQSVDTSGQRQLAIELVINGPDINQLKKYSDQLTKRMKERGGFVDVDTNLSMRKPELRVLPKREALSDLGVSLNSIATMANVLVGGEPIGKFKVEDEQYDIWLRAEEQYRSSPEVIGQMSVPSSKSADKVIRLDAVADLVEAVGPSTITRFGRQRMVEITCNLEGKDAATARKELEEELQALNMSSEYRYSFEGNAKLQQESNDNFAVGFLLAFIFMYMILAAQFESFLQPVAILSALPLTVPFAVLSLIFLQTNLDLFGMLGVFMLFGIVKKNGILQVDYTNQLRQQGMDMRTAILEANRARLRPILMTTVMLVAAMIPMAMSNGPGANTRASLAKVVFGGQILSLLLTLIITPVTYSILEGFVAWRERRKARRAEEQDSETDSTSSETDSASSGGSRLKDGSGMDAMEEITRYDYTEKPREQGENTRKPVAS